MSARQDRKARRLNKQIAKTMRFDLRSPCSDCPFRTDAPMHEGIIAELPSKLDSLQEGILAHTCHQTDPRADCRADKRAPAGSPVQHCAGALIFAENVGLPQLPAIAAEAKGIYNPKRLNMSAPVFDSQVKMLLHYIPGMIAKFPHHPQTKKLRVVERQLREKLP